MTTAKIDVDSLIAALTDVTVIEALTKALLPSIQAAVGGLMAETAAVWRNKETLLKHWEQNCEL